jgi:hypothetical protein
MSKNQKTKWQEECIEAMEGIKGYLISKGGNAVSKNVITEILEIEGFPSEADAIHPITEENLLKAIFFSHAHAVENVINTVIQMLKDGVLEANGDMANKIANQLREQNEYLANEELTLEDDDDIYTIEEDDDE